MGALLQKFRVDSNTFAYFILNSKAAVVFWQIF